jgi:hypothetical protein
MFRLAFIGACLALAGCRTFDPKHPLSGKPVIEPAQTGYWIWISDGQWHLRMTSGQKGHRFQGSMAGVNGSVADLSPTRPELQDRIALVGDSVQFDLEAGPSAGGDGFDAKVAGGCARFDLYIDGRRRGDQVRLGPRNLPPRRIPFEKCP